MNREKLRSTFLVLREVESHKINKVPRKIITVYLIFILIQFYFIFILIYLFKTKSWDSNEIHISIFSTQTAATFQSIKLEHDCGRKFDR